MLTVREYREEFYEVNLRVGYVEESAEKDARYVNGLRMDIQEEMYQCALRVEENLARK